MAQPDVVIIGGGIIGLSCASRLARDGLKTVVLERGGCGEESSWAGVGILSPCSWHRRDDLARIHMDAIFRYHEFAAQLHDDSGIDPQYQRCGELKPILDDNRMKMAVREVQAIGQRRTPEGQPIAETLSPEQARALQPGIQKDMLGAQHVRLTAQVRNTRLLTALRESCLRAGVEIREGTAVRGLMKDGPTVRGALTDAGQVPGGTTLLCAGAWSSQLDPLLAEQMPVHPVRGQIILLHMERLPFDCIVYQEESHFYMVPRRDGYLLIGTTEEHDSGFSKRNTAEALKRLSALALAYAPDLAQATLVKCWAGLRPGTPDRRPFMGTVPGLEHFIAASGHFRTGLTCAPAVADIVADLVQTGSCQYDLRKAAPGREVSRK